MIENPATNNDSSSLSLLHRLYTPQNFNIDNFPKRLALDNEFPFNSGHFGVSHVCFLGSEIDVDGTTGGIYLYIGTSRFRLQSIDWLHV